MAGKPEEREETPPAPPNTPIIDRTSTLPFKNRRLDAIARLINGNEVCSAVCFCDDKIIVANNSGQDNDLIQRYFSVFQHCTTSTTAQIKSLEFKARISAMVAESKKEMFLARKEEIDQADQIKGIVDGTTRDPTRIQQVLAREKQTLLQAAGSPPEMTSLAGKRLKQLQENEATDAKTALGKSNEHYQRRKQQFLAQVEHQAERLERDLTKISLSLALDALPERAFDPRIREAFRQRPVILQTSAPAGMPHHAAAAATTAPLPHAEMQILDYLIATNGPTIAKSQKDIPLYIGVTKLCCQDCHASINALNKTRSRPVVVETEEVAPETITLETQGTHLKAYSTWTMPAFMARDTELQRIYQHEKEILQPLVAGMGRKEEADRSGSDPSTTPREGSFVDALTKDTEVLHHAAGTPATPPVKNDPTKPQTLRK